MQSKLVRFTSLFAPVVVLFAPACALPEASPAAQVELDGEVAKAQAQALSAAVASAQVDDGLAIAESLAAAAGASAALVPEARAGVVSKLTRTSTTCACDVATRTCTFSKCTIGDAIVSGALSWTGGTIRSSKLAVEIPPTSRVVGAGYVMVDASLVYGAGRIAGSLHTTGSAAVDAVVYRWDSTIDVNDVTFTSTAFTGGSIDVGAAVTMDSVTTGARTFETSGVVALP